MNPGAMRIIVSQYAPAPRLLRYPAKGPYYQRRLRRMKRDPRSWTKPEFMIAGHTIIVHPSLERLLREQLAFGSGTMTARVSENQFLW